MTMIMMIHDSYVADNDNGGIQPVMVGFMVMKLITIVMWMKRRGKIRRKKRTRSLLNQYLSYISGCLSELPE